LIYTEKRIIFLIKYIKLILYRKILNISLLYMLYIDR
jgi:hypothetical protein